MDRPNDVALRRQGTAGIVADVSSLMRSRSKFYKLATSKFCPSAQSISPWVITLPSLKVSVETPPFLIFCAPEHCHLRLCRRTASSQWVNERRMRQRDGDRRERSLASQNDGFHVLLGAGQIVCSVAPSLPLRGIPVITALNRGWFRGSSSDVPVT